MKQIMRRKIHETSRRFSTVIRNFRFLTRLLMRTVPGALLNINKSKTDSGHVINVECNRIAEEW